MFQDYYLGLDIGTNSCGYAVTDTNYNILRIKGKKAWGIRLFDEANTAESRRIKRTNRRRLQRKKLRILWLQQLFADEINKVDPNFFSRLKYSSLWAEDKLVMNNLLISKDSLFCDKDKDSTFSDKDFYKEYKTIYHLRKKLTQKPAKDIRYLYLALHNIIKRRGHFLYEGSFGENIDLQKLINDNVQNIKNIDENTQFELKQVEQKDVDEIINTLKNNLGIRDTKQKFYTIFNTNDKLSKKLVDCFVDGKLNIKDIFDIETDENLKIAFGDENFEDTTMPLLESVLSDDQLEIINNLREIYSTIQLKKFLGNNNYLCESMVDIYETHQKQLEVFKNFIKKYYPAHYNEIFRDATGHNGTNYSLYINTDLVDGKKQVIGLNNKDRSQESFYKFVKVILSKEPEVTTDINDYTAKKEQILKWIETNTFLPKPRSKTNAIFPNKIYEKELCQILKINATKFSFLNNKDDSGLTVSDKIISILKFRIPYFVGPIGKNNNDENKFGWVEKESDLPLTPWNLSKIINFDKAEDAFILKMTNQCSYLHDQDVLPNNSILYSKFRVLNELNKLKINGNNISVELKQNIFNDLFKNKKKITVKQIKEYLVGQGYYSLEEMHDIVISGIDKEFANNFSPYVTLKDILGEAFIEKNISIVENIIKYHTIISDKNRLERRLKNEYADVLSNDQIKKLKSLNFSGWGRLSKQFLQDFLFVNKETGEVTNIINEMWSTNNNLQELLFDTSYTLNEKLEDYNKNKLTTITYDNVKELYCSPSVKRGVWQTIKIINEILALTGKMPEKVFVEVTREDQTKGDAGRKLSRKTSLLDIYNSKDFHNNVYCTTKELDDLINQLNKMEDNSLRSEKLYLYFLQLGKCAYSGEPINIEELYNEHSYDVDHIIPQSIIKDDSIDNKVLVKRIYNDNKGDHFPIASAYPEWVSKQKSFWQMLKSLNLMSESKLSRLVRTSTLTEEEVGSFVARQLVETNQSAKAVIDLLKTIVDNPRKIVYSKAKFVSEFRKKFDIPKCREINDLHHAKDAYLNIVVGNILFSRFTDDPRNFYRKKNKNNGLTKNIVKLFEKEVYNPYDNQIIWSGEDDIQKIKKICTKNDCLVSTMSFSKENGQFYDETIYKSQHHDAKSLSKISLKGSTSPLHDYTKYGGYDNMTIAYFMVLESEDKKGNKIKTIETVPTVIAKKYKNDIDKNNKILQYVIQTNNLKNAKIILPKLNIKSTLIINGGEYLIAGKTNNYYSLHNANQWFVSDDDTKYIKAIVKYMDMKKNKKTNYLAEENDKVVLSKASKDGNTEITLTKAQNEGLYSAIIQQLEKSFYQDYQLQTTLLPKLKDKINEFYSLDVLSQSEQLYNIIKRVAPGNFNANLALIGESPNAAKILLNKDITNKNIKLIIRSATGLQQKIISL